MATFGATVRRGLPRRPGGDPWPAAGEAPAAASPIPVVERAHRDETPVAAATGGALRRGLPRVAGGEPWPPAGPAPAVVTATPTPTPTPIPIPVPTTTPEPVAESVDASPLPVVERAQRDESHVAAATGGALRRGLPRVAGGEPWPPAGFAPKAATAPEVVSLPAVEHVLPSGPRPPLPFPRTVWPGAAARSRPETLAEPEATGIRSLLRRPPWPVAVSGVFAALALLILAASAVLFVRWFLSLSFMQDFLATYPGESELPEGAPVGIPGWLAWQHFFNVFFMVLIIRTGLQVRRDKRPSAFWTPSWSKNGRGKISLSLWFHQSLDILWLANGIIFVVLLFATGQWMRVVPTSWDIIPNAISAALQYVSLDWPTEDGWVNYNSLQVLAYFVTIFIAAPLAAITGVRMSGLWPKNAERLNRAYPIEWARAVHFPVMLYFVLFIIVHVTLVFATGALRNLNHMYGGQDAVNWTGFWIFMGSLVLIVAAWIAARPLVLAPIARLSGKVSQR